MRLEALDEDTASDDWIGATMPLSFGELVNSSDKVMRKLEFVDKAGKEVGYINISTQYIWIEGPNSSHASNVHSTGRVINSSSSPYHQGATTVIRSGDYHNDSSRIVHSVGDNLVSQIRNSPSHHGSTVIRSGDNYHSGATRVI